MFKNINRTLSQLRQLIGGLIFASLSALSQNALAEIEFTTGSLSVLETDGTATLSVTRTGVAPNTAAAVTIVVTHGTATSGVDYSLSATTLNWTVGETGAKTITVSIIQDSETEGTETAYFALTNVSGDTLGTQDTTLLSIIDPNLSVADDPGLTTQQYEAAVVLDNLCASSQGASIQGCTLLQTLSDTEQVQTLESILPRNVVQQASNASVAQTGSTQAVRIRMQNVRMGNDNPLAGFSLLSDGMGQSLAGLLENPEPYRGGSAGDSGLGENWGVFLSGQLQTTDQNSTEDILGYQSDAYQITGGLDYRFGRDLFVGAALSFSQVSTDANAGLGKQDSAVAILSMFSSYYFTEQLYMDAVVSIGASDFDMQRNFIFGDAVARADADTTGDQYGVSVGGGYELALGYWQLSAYGRVDMTQITVDAYEESGGAGLALAVAERKTEQSQGVLGGSIGLVKSWKNGVLIPKLTAEWVKEFENDQPDTRAFFVTDPDSGYFVLTGTDLDSDYLNVGGSLAATFRYGLSAYVRYESVVGKDDYVSETFAIGGRWSF